MVIECLKTIRARLVGAYLVLRGTAMAVPVFDEDTTIVVIETDGSQVSFLSCRSFVENEKSYNLLLTKLLLWVCTHNRFFWTSDPLGSRLKEAAEEYFEEHKN